MTDSPHLVIEDVHIKTNPMDDELDATLMTNQSEEEQHLSSPSLYSEFGSSTKKMIPLGIVNLIIYCLMILIMLISSYEYIGKGAPADIISKYFTYFTPARFTFLICPIIFAIQAIFIIYQFVPIIQSCRENRENNYLEINTYGYESRKLIYSNVSIFIGLAWLGQILWIIFFCYELMPLALFASFFTWANLATIYYRIHSHRKKSFIFMFTRLSRSFSNRPDEIFFNYVSIYLPTTLYFAWTSAMILLQTLTFATKENHGVPIHYGWAIGCTIILSSFTVIVSALTLDFMFVLTIIWTLIGIAIRQNSSSEEVAIICWVLAILLGIIILGLIIPLRNEILRKRQQAKNDNIELSTQSLTREQQEPDPVSASL